MSMLLCRLCLGKNSHYLEIYSELGNQLKIYDIVSQHLSLHIQENDILSSKVCTICWNKLMEFHDFYMTIQSAQETIKVGSKLLSLSEKTNSKEIPIADTILKVNSTNLQFSNNVDVHVNDTVGNINIKVNETFKVNDLQEQDLKHESQQHKNKHHPYEDISDLELESPATVFIHSTVEEDEDEQNVQNSSQFTTTILKDDFLKDNSSEPNEIVEELQEQSKLISQLQKEDYLENNNNCEKDFAISISELDDSDNNATKLKTSSILFSILSSPLSSITKTATVNSTTIVSPSSFIKHENQSDFSEEECRDDKDGISTDSEEFIPKKKNTSLSSASTSSASKLYRQRWDKVNSHKKEESVIVNKKNEEKLIESYYKMRCEICHENLEHFEKLFDHYLKSHNIRGFIICCGKKFFKRPVIAEHVLWHEQPDLFKCKICDKLFPDKRSLNNHLITHAPPDMELYKCEHCSKSFEKKFKLDRHKLSHLRPEEKKYVCDECGKPYASRTSLKSHKRVVHEKTYAHMCEVCAKVFKSRAFFEKHQLEHLGKNLPRVQCSICKAWMKNEHTMRAHMRLHQDAGSIHECDICGKQGPSRNAVLKHKRFVHFSERKYKCTLCDKAFKRAITLKEHMSIHTGEVLYTCTFCPKTFNSGANMHAHRKKAHPVEWEEEKRNKMESTKP